MRNRYSLYIEVGLFVALLLSASWLVLAQEDKSQDEATVQAALGTAFTYQGRLTGDTTPVSGTCDFTFTLYDAASGGSPVGLANKPNVPVEDGYFGVQLDFGASAFEGDARYLEIAVDCGDEATTLAPRQPLTAAPYALYARAAGSTEALQGQAVAGTLPTTGQVLKWNGSQWVPAADAQGSGGGITAVIAGTGLLGGGDSGDVTLHVDLAGSGSADAVARSDHDHNTRYYSQAALQNGTADVHWDALTDVPAGLADGDDDTTYSAGTGLALTGTQFGVTFGGNGSAETVARSDHDHGDTYQGRYARTVVVSPVGDGSDQQANGAALLSALNGITDAGATNPYLLKIEPGIYDVGSTPVTMQSYVDIEGSGIAVTEIKGSGFDAPREATVIGANDAELRFLTVTSDGDGQDAFANTVYADRKTGFRLSHLRIRALDGLSYSYAVHVNFGGIVLEHVSIQAIVDSSGTACVGLLNEGAVLNMDTVEVASYDGRINIGVAHRDTTTPPDMANVKVTLSGGSSARGVDNGNASPEMSNVTVEVSSAEFGYAIYNGGTSSAPVLRNVTASSSRSSTWDYGLYNAGGSQTVTIDRSTIRGDTHSIRNGPNASATLLIGASQLEGSINNDGGGTFTCVASYDGDYVALSTTCQ